MSAASAPRVAMVVGSVSHRAGGLFHSVRRLSQSLAESGVEVTVLAPRDDAAEADLAAWAPLRPRLFDRRGPAALGHAPGLGRALEETGADVVHLHGLWQLTSWQVLRWARRTGGPVMISPRGMLDPWALRQSGWKKRLALAAYERSNLRSAACLHALAPAEAAAIRDAVPGVPVLTIPNGVDLGPPPARRARGEGPATLLFLGRLHPKKGLTRLISDWASLTGAQRGRWRLAIAGWDEGGHRAALEAQVRALGCGGSVEFPGPLLGAARARALADADAFVLPSHSEGLPMAVLEAWAAGLPVFMTRACNLPEGFAAGAAVEITPGPGWLAAALGRGDLNAMGAAGRRLVARRFAWPLIAARHAGAYGWMLGRAPRPEGLAA